MEYASNMEYYCSGETQCDNTAADHQVDAWVKKTRSPLVKLLLSNSSVQFCSLLVLIKRFPRFKILMIFIKEYIFYSGIPYQVPYSTDEICESQVFYKQKLEMFHISNILIRLYTFCSVLKHF
jgi:hypothetical protein